MRSWENSVTLKFQSVFIYISEGSSIVRKGPVNSRQGEASGAFQGGLLLSQSLRSIRSSFTMSFWVLVTLPCI